MSLLTNVVLPSTLVGDNSAGYELYVYHGEREHPCAPGNKWHKLQHHLKAAQQQGAKTLATFGGPYSNHLHAFGHPQVAPGFKKVAIVRGELQPQLTPMLTDLAKHNVELWPSTRKDYALGMNSQRVNDINQVNANVYWIPEGGGGPLGALGCVDWANDILSNAPQFDTWVLAAGTGTTAAGLLAHKVTPEIQVFSALKGMAQQRNEILELAMSLSSSDVVSQTLDQKFVFNTDSHFGGYAKYPKELADFLFDVNLANPNLHLDPVYTAKALHGVMARMKRQTWPYRKTLFIHTGGLQGWRGVREAQNPYRNI
ncbi:1-aminocyclopropane-1-carboxylate deaminase/D-cysteine desulfhydrase [Marinomonas epiphytica]